MKMNSSENLTRGEAPGATTLFNLLATVAAASAPARLLMLTRLVAEASICSMSDLIFKRKKKVEI